jgi:hypothetical protein
VAACHYLTTSHYRLARGYFAVLLIVMYQARTWRLRPGETFTFGRSPTSSAVLPAEDRGLSRQAGSFSYHLGSWWVRNDSRSSLLYLSGDRGFRVDLPPGMQMPLQQWPSAVSRGCLIVCSPARRSVWACIGPDAASGCPGKTFRETQPRHVNHLRVRIGQEHPVIDPMRQQD